MANQLLQNILDQIGEGKSPTTTVRTFLAWFDAYRRRAGVVDRIRAELAEYELETVPDFESAWIDSFISFVAIAPPDIEADRLCCTNREGFPA
ncbi:hypothetical protein [Cypionkella sp. TWP1-2-1b2]|uniref:hypothetical protein n=1 Tax=Cypionkella sp. TWP1-2-1b2 TaxID=2804675 RepID=UPI003CED07D1